MAFSLVGIPVAALLAPSLAKFVNPALKVLGVAHPLFLWLMAPLVVFIIVLVVFKIAAFFVHQKVYVHYKYKTGDLRFALWERLNGRLGMCLGTANGLMYFIIISWLIYSLGYWTVQVGSPNNDARVLKILNRLSWDLEKTGMSKAAAAVDKTPDKLYEAADMAGLLFQNSLLEARLSRYPAFLSLGERTEFQAIAKDQALMEMRLRGAPVRELLANPQVDQIVRNPQTLKLIWDTVEPNLRDLTNYLVTSRSTKYDSEPILGRWTFNAGASILVYRREKPNALPIETQRIHEWMAGRFAKAMVVAAPDRQIFLKEFPAVRSPGGAAPSAELQSLSGQWKGGDGNYVLTMSDPGDERTARMEGGKLLMRYENFPLAFEKEQ